MVGGGGTWDEAIAAAGPAGLIGPLHALAHRLPVGSRPDTGTLDALQSRYYDQAARNAELLGVLREVIAALAARGIAVIPLKGAALVEAVYRNLALRAMRDLDVLVRREDLDAAATVVENLGFTPDEWYRPRQWYLEQMHHLVPYQRAGVTLEIHHHLLPPWISPQPDPTDLWTRSREAVVAGAPARILAPDDQLLHLALHAVIADGFVGSLAGLRDLVELQARCGGEIDWPRLAVTARGQERAVVAAFELVGKLLGTPPPAAALEALKPGRFGRGEVAALARLARPVVLGGDRDSGVIPAWFRQVCLAQVLRRRSWAGRAVAVVRDTIAVWARHGEARGLKRTAPIYGAVVHPWRALRRRLRKDPLS
jgi:hypothetical protein